MKIIPRIISWLVTVSIPLALIFLGLRLMLTHAFLQVEYHMPGFPEDEYGFTHSDRLRYAPLALDYLTNDAEIPFLGDQTFPDGSNLYNGRELSHMQDVKNVVRPLLWSGYSIWVFLVLVGIWACSRGWWDIYVRGIRRGGWLTFGLVGAIGIFAAVSFWKFFTIFHGLFFSEGSWMFLYSDTLIRLFPMRFWQDAVLFLMVFTAGFGLLLGLLLKPKRRPKAG